MKTIQALEAESVLNVISPKNTAPLTSCHTQQILILKRVRHYQLKPQFNNQNLNEVSQRPGKNAGKTFRLLAITEIND